MKTTVFWILWVLLPVGLAAWHFGPGQQLLHRDLAADQLKFGRRVETMGDWKSAAASYSLANQQWPEDSVSSRRLIRLAEANATINAGDLVIGQQQLDSLISEMEDDEQADGDLLATARHDLATSCYYAAWMMRLEGAEADEWLQEAELARQHFRLLAETSDGRQQQVAAENLEATIRLEQMDLRTLMAKPLPKNCCSNCSNLCQKKRKQMTSRCKKGDKEGKKKEGPKDVRKEIKKNNSAGLNEGSGSGS